MSDQENLLLRDEIAKLRGTRTQALEQVATQHSRIKELLDENDELRARLSAVAHMTLEYARWAS